MDGKSGKESKDEKKKDEKTALVDKPEEDYGQLLSCTCN